ncbi:MAG: MFS transporter, partial [Longispora sp.]|nr:MFS transporter [Longispora sp. (in: high G+C Gram-positive bacteria)]
GASLATAMTVPVAHALGGWHAGLAVWGAVAALAVLPWILLRSHDRKRKSAQVAATDIRPGRTRLGWALALFFGTQSLNAYVIMSWLPRLYRDAGFSAQTSGLLVAGVMVLGVPMSLLVPAVASKFSDHRIIALIINACYGLGFVGLLIAPLEGALLWTLLLGIGQGTFPLVMTMIGLRSRTAAGTVALSAFAQSTGYLLAATGPIFVGMLYSRTHTWLLPLLFLVAVVLIQSVAGLVAGRPRFLEDACVTHR